MREEAACVCFSRYFFANSNQSISVAKKPFCGAGYCPLDPKSWHLWILVERKSKMVLRSILKKFYCHFRVCVLHCQMCFGKLFLQHCLAVKRVKESSLGCCARQELQRREYRQLEVLRNNSKQINQHPKRLLFLALFNCEQFLQRARQIKSLLLNTCLLNKKPKMHPIGTLGFIRS